MLLKLFYKLIFILAVHQLLWKQVLCKSILEVDLSNLSAWVCELFDSMTGRNQFAIDKINYKFIYTRPDNGSMTVLLTWLYSRLIRTRPIHVDHFYTMTISNCMPILCVRHNGDNTASLIAVLIKSAFSVQGFKYVGISIHGESLPVLSLVLSYWKESSFAVPKLVLDCEKVFLLPFLSECLCAFDMIMYSLCNRKKCE